MIASLTDPRDVAWSPGPCATSQLHGPGGHATQRRQYPKTDPIADRLISRLAFAAVQSDARPSAVFCHSTLVRNENSPSFGGFHKRHDTIDLRLPTVSEHSLPKHLTA